jgi:hypothetical protein
MHRQVARPQRCRDCPDRSQIGRRCIHYVYILNRQVPLSSGRQTQANGVTARRLRSMGSPLLLVQDKMRIHATSGATLRRDWRAKGWRQSPCVQLRLPRSASWIRYRILQWYRHGKVMRIPTVGFMWGVLSTSGSREFLWT